jgi:hypothetical protein
MSVVSFSRTSKWTIILSLIIVLKMNRHIIKLKLNVCSFIFILIVDETIVSYHIEGELILYYTVVHRWWVNNKLYHNERQFLEFRKVFVNISPMNMINEHSFIIG